MNNLDKYISFLKEKGIVYNNLLEIENDLDYINVTLLSRQDALEALKILIDSNKIILGGDVFIEDKNEYVPDYANWYYEIENNNDLKHNIKNSYTLAKNFIENYKEKENTKTYYLLVVDKE